MKKSVAPLSVSTHAGGGGGGGTGGGKGESEGSGGGGEGDSSSGKKLGKGDGDGVGDGSASSPSFSSLVSGGGGGGGSGGGGGFGSGGVGGGIGAEKQILKPPAVTDPSDSHPNVLVATPSRSSPSSVPSQYLYGQRSTRTKSYAHDAEYSVSSKCTASVTRRVKASWQLSELPYSSEAVAADEASHSPTAMFDEHTQLVTRLTTHGAWSLAELATSDSAPGNAGGEGGGEGEAGGGEGEGARGPQSSQSEPYAQRANSKPGPPSSHSASFG